MGEQPCREFEIFRERTEMEHEEAIRREDERRREHQDQKELIGVLKDLIAGQNIRITMLEQQNKLIFWIGAVITSAFVVALVGMFIKVMENTAIIN
jgi:hypothetical protein